MLWREVQTGLDLVGRFAGSSNWWWMVMTGVVVRVSVLSGGGKLNTGGR
jgi:hypothetical protein